MKVFVLALLLANGTAKNLKELPTQNLKSLAQTSNKKWSNDYADIVNANEYAQSMNSALADQDMHDTDKYSMSYQKYQSMMQSEELKNK